MVVHLVRKTVDALCTDHPRVKEGLRILNVGFGLGIVSAESLYLSPLVDFPLSD